MSRFRSNRQFAAASLVLLVTLVTGCETVVDTFKQPTPGDRAREAFNAFDADKRRRAVNDLSAASFGGEDPYLRVYRLLVTDTDPTVRAACMKALGEHGTVEDTEILVSGLKDEFAFVRWEAAKALQRIHDPDVATTLARTVTADDDADVRQAAASALGQYPMPAVFTALVAALDDREFGVVHAASKSLSTLTGEQLGDDAPAWLAWSDANHDRLFAGQRTYYWKPYEQPRGWIDKVQFWKDYEPPAPQLPVGADGKPADGSDQAASRS